MRKPSKLRKWLIKKLGGITPDHKIEPILIKQQHKIKEIEVSVFDFGLLTPEKIARELSLKLGEAVIEDAIIIGTHDANHDCAKYIATLKVVEL